MDSRLKERLRIESGSKCISDRRTKLPFLGSGPPTTKDPGFAPIVAGVVYSKQVSPRVLSSHSGPITHHQLLLPLQCHPQSHPGVTVLTGGCGGGGCDEYDSIHVCRT